MATFSDADVRARLAGFRNARPAPALLDAALLVAACDRPEFDPADVRRRLEALAVAARDRLADATGDAGRRVADLCGYLADERGFVGDPERYHEPSNSRIDEVLRQGRGLPITLAVIYVETGARLGLDCEGVNFPGHFLVRMRAPERPGDPVLVDPFNGRVVTPAQCEATLRRVLGNDAESATDHLAAASAEQVLVRMLNNLKQLALSESRLADALRWSERILLVNPALVLEHRDRAELLARLGEPEMAALELEHLAAAITDEEQIARLRAGIERLRAGRDGGRVVH